jgi:hypothetical protein
MKTGREKSGVMKYQTPGEILAVMFAVLIKVILSRINVMSKLIMWYTLNMYSLLYIKSLKINIYEN